jgi:hypothetical protein
VPEDVDPGAAPRPTVDGVEGAGEYTGEALDIGRKWEPAANTRDCFAARRRTAAPPARPAAHQHRTPRSPAPATTCTSSSTSRTTSSPTPAKPEECVAHWLPDSVEIIIDPRGNASQVLKDTANTFKLGVFPFTNDPGNTNGNGVNGPCWSRTPTTTRASRPGRSRRRSPTPPNAPGVIVKSTATWVGSNDTRQPLLRRGGRYNLEVKIPMADLPAASTRTTWA